MRATSFTRTLEPSGFSRMTTFAELLGLDEAALRAHGVRELLPGRRGLGADLAGGVDDVLLRGGVLDVGDRQARAREHDPG